MDKNQRFNELIPMEGKVIQKVAWSVNPDTVFIYTSDSLDSPVDDWTVHYFNLTESMVNVTKKVEGIRKSANGSEDYFRAKEVRYLISLIDQYKEALQKLDEVIHFDRQEETWMDEAMLGVNTGVELSIRKNHIEVIKRLNEAKKFAKEVLEKE